jgi:hypothetical protein
MPTVIVTTETLKQSVMNDVCTVAIVGVPLFVNEMTLQSSFINFVFLMMLAVFGLCHCHMIKPNRRVIRGTEAEIMAKLPAILQQPE